MIHTRLAGWWALLILGTLCGAANCSRVSGSSYEKIKDGMSLAEVKAILGEPTETTGLDIGIASGTMATWKSDKAKIVVQLVNDKVIGKQYVTSD